MTKAKRFSIYFLSLLLMIMSLGLLGMPKTLSLVNADTADISTIFVRDASIVTNNETHLFVYDNLDQKIKVLDLANNKVASFSSIEISSPIAMKATATHLFVLTETELKVYNASTLENITISNTSEITSFEDFADISLFESSSTEIFALLIPKTESDANLSIINCNIEAATIEKAYSIEFGGTFVTENLTNGIAAASVISKSADSLQILLQSGSAFYTFAYNLAAPTAISTWTTLSLGSDNHDSFVTKIDDLNVIVTLSNTMVTYFVYNPLSSPEITTLGSFDASLATISIYGKTLMVKENEQNFKVSYYTLALVDSDPKEITTTLVHSYENQDFERINSEAQRITYYKLLDDATIYPLPFSSEGQVLSKGTHVALLATPKANGVEFGYSYCLAIKGNQNIFGYIKSSLLSPLEITSYKHEYVYVIDNTLLFSLPSNNIDAADGNTLLDHISMKDKVKVLSSICDAEMGGRKYLLVEVNGKIGFILRDRVSGKYINQQLVVTNAELKTDVKVYLDADTQSQIIDTLQAGTRVRVTSTRRVDSEFLQITYNDLEGNEITGYVLSSAIETDSWSMLQILGMALVIVNLIFLVIILAVRKKINKD